MKAAVCALSAPELNAVGPTAPGGSAYRLPGGEVLVTWPRSGSSYSGPGVCDEMAEEAHELVALGLSAEDCASVCARWRGGAVSVERDRALRRLLLGGIAARRAAERAHLLRDLRRGLPPPGSLSSAFRPYKGCMWPLLRFPSGRGWWGERWGERESGYSREPRPWPWPDYTSSYDAAPARLVALGLSEADCLALAGEEDLAGAVQVLRKRGLL